MRGIFSLVCCGGEWGGAQHVPARGRCDVYCGGNPGSGIFLFAN